MSKGRLLVIEGLDGSGKATQQSCWPPIWPRAVEG